MSIGVPGQWEGPQDQGGGEVHYRDGPEKRVPPRVELADFRDAEPYLKMGVKHFCVGWDIDVIHRYCKDQGAAFGRKIWNHKSRGMRD